MDEGRTAERKFLAAPPAEAFAAAWLGHACDPDPAYPAGTVTSVYYDTLDLASYREKLNGDFVKSKVRLRWYEDEARPGAAGGEAFLELKRRVGAARRKLRQPVVLDRAWLTRVPLDDPDLRALPYRAGGPLLPGLPPDLHPTLALTYRRRRYVCPRSGARVALDTGVRVTRLNPARLPAAGLPALAVVVVEVKGPAVEVPWLGELFRAGFRLRAFSKYAACMAGVLEGAAP